MDRVYCQVVCNNCGISKGPFVRAEATRKAGDHNVKFHGMKPVAKVKRL